jgi:hydrogenase maturation protease
MAVSAPYLVLGLGNELFTDEGLGVVASRTFAERGIADVEVVDGGTLGLELVATIEGREGLLVLDAVASDGATPGDILVLEGEELEMSRQLLFSVHQIGVVEALAAAELIGAKPDRVAAVGMVPFSLDTGYGITPEAATRMPEMIAAAEEVLGEWGLPLELEKHDA